jgi:hypothetical protein
VFTETYAGYTHKCARVHVYQYACIYAQVKHVIGAQGSGPGEFQGPLGIAVTKEGRVYVADYGNHRIQEFTETFEWVQVCASVYFMFVCACVCGVSFSCEYGI